SAPLRAGAAVPFVAAYFATRRLLTAAHSTVPEDLTRGSSIDRYRVVRQTAFEDWGEGAVTDSARESVQRRIDRRRFLYLTGGAAATSLLADRLMSSIA